MRNIIVLLLGFGLCGCAFKKDATFREHDVPVIVYGGSNPPIYGLGGVTVSGKILGSALRQLVARI